MKSSRVLSLLAVTCCLLLSDLALVQAQIRSTGTGCPSNRQKGVMYCMKTFLGNDQCGKCRCNINDDQYVCERCEPVIEREGYRLVLGDSNQQYPACCTTLVPDKTTKRSIDTGEEPPSFLVAYDGRVYWNYNIKQPSSEQVKEWVSAYCGQNENGNLNTTVNSTVAQITEIGNETVTDSADKNTEEVGKNVKFITIKYKDGKKKIIYSADNLTKKQLKYLMAKRNKNVMVEKFEESKGHAKNGGRYSVSAKDIIITYRNGKKVSVIRNRNLKQARKKRLETQFDSILAKAGLEYKKKWRNNLVATDVTVTSNKNGEKTIVVKKRNMRTRRFTQPL